MKSLIISCLALSLVDSVNPIAITQQFVLQGMVSKARHIWFYILALAFTNMAAGFLVYYGLAGFIKSFFEFAAKEYSRILYISIFLLGIIFLLGAIFVILRLKFKVRSDDNNEKIIAYKIRSVSPISLFLIGVVSTAAELTSALPYFAFLTVLVGYNLSIFGLLLIFILYNFIWVCT